MKFLIDHAVFLNPNLDPNSMKIGPPPEEVSFSTQLARRVADQIIESYRSLSRSSLVGGLLADIEQLFAYLEYQDENSVLMKLYDEIISTEGTLGELIQDTSTFTGKIN